MKEIIMDKKNLSGSESVSPEDWGYSLSDIHRIKTQKGKNLSDSQPQLTNDCITCPACGKQIPSKIKNVRKGV
jgi:hypothetical protein